MIHLHRHVEGGLQELWRGTQVRVWRQWRVLCMLDSAGAGRQLVALTAHGCLQTDVDLGCAQPAASHLEGADWRERAGQARVQKGDKVCGKTHKKHAAAALLWKCCFARCMRDCVPVQCIRHLPWCKPLCLQVTKKRIAVVGKQQPEAAGWEELRASLSVTWPHLLYLVALLAASLYFIINASLGAYK